MPAAGMFRPVLRWPEAVSVHWSVHVCCSDWCTPPCIPFCIAGLAACAFENVHVHVYEHEQLMDE